MRKEAERDIVKPEICHLEESAEPEVKKYFKVVEKSADKAASESENSDKSRDSSPTPSAVVATASTKG